MELTGGQAGTVVLFRARGEVATAAPICWQQSHLADARRLRALDAAAHALDGLLEAHASLELSAPAEVRAAIGDGPTDALGADTLVAYPIVWRAAVAVR